MTIQVKGPDGAIVQFPDNTSNDVMEKALREHYATASQPQAQAPAAADTGNWFGGGDKVSPYGLSDLITGTQQPNGRSDVGGVGKTMVDFALGGVTDKTSAGALGLIQGGIVDPVMGRGFNIGNRYNEILSQERDNQRAYEAAHPTAAMRAKIAGAGLGMAMMPSIGSGLLGAARTGAVYGGTLGATQDADSLDEHIKHAVEGAGVGAVASGALGAVIKYAPAAFNAVAAPISGYFNPEKMANRILVNAVTKAKTSVPAIQAELTQAASEGQPMFTVADAMGAPGRELTSTLARSPHSMQSVLADTLTDRQMGQSGRVSQFLTQALNANQTAEQAAKSLTAMRGRVADVGYDVARNGAGPVDLTKTVNAIDGMIGPQAKFNVGIDPDSTEAALFRLRNTLAVGDKGGMTTRADFSEVLRQKGELRDKIDALYQAGKSVQAGKLNSVYKELDKALEGSSAAYRAANDTFAKMSRPIEAVDAGKQAARPGARAADNIAEYAALDPHSQGAFKVGYADPILAKVEAAASGVNTARQFSADKYQQELGAMARDPALIARQLARENTMNATMQRALGGSKSADNLLNEADLSSISPSELLSASRGGITGIASLILSKGGNLLTGKNANVRSKLTEALLSQNPSKILAQFEKAKFAAAARNAKTVTALAPVPAILPYELSHR